MDLTTRSRLFFKFYELSTHNTLKSSNFKHTPLKNRQITHHFHAPTQNIRPLDVLRRQLVRILQQFIRSHHGQPPVLLPRGHVVLKHLGVPFRDFGDVCVATCVGEVPDDVREDSHELPALVFRRH